MAEQLLARLGQEYNFSLLTLTSDSPAGQRLAQVSGLPFPPGIYINWELVAYGRPSMGKMRREFAVRFGPPSNQDEN